MSASHFREFEVRQPAMALAKQVYEMRSASPREERYGPGSQLQRAAGSIPSTREYAGFVSAAQVSNTGLQTRLNPTGELAPGDEASRRVCLEPCDRVERMPLRPHQPLERRIQSECRVPSPESR